MIIDMILDRRGFEKDGDYDYYNPKRFYDYVMEEESIFDMPRDISKAMDYGTEDDVRKALCDYVTREGYSEDICDYVNSVDWLEPNNAETAGKVNKVFPKEKKDKLKGDVDDFFADFDFSQLQNSRKPVKSALDTVRITFDNGETMVTDFNGDVSREECANYYYGKWFNLGYRDDKEDDMHKVVKVEFPPFDEKISRNQASFNSFMRYK